MKAPIFLCLPDLVRGMPIRLEILALKAEMPKKRLQENPPRFICLIPHKQSFRSRLYVNA